jgi:hypothetical protein
MWWILGIIAAISVIAYYVYRKAESTIKADAIKKSQLSAIGLD